MTDPSNAELVARIQALEQQVAHLAHHLGLTGSGPPVGPDPLAQVRAEAMAGRKIPAIKAYRELTGCSLGEAKAAVDAMAGGR